MMYRRYCLLLICFLFGAIHLFAGDDADALVKKLQKKYDSIKNLSVKFVEHVQFGVTKSEQNFHGTFSMKKGNKFSIDMEQQSIVTDGKSVWTFNKTTNQVLIDHYRDESTSTSPEKILSNISGTYSAVFTGKETTGDTELVILKLTPKKNKSNVKSLKLWIDQDELLMKKIQVLDTSDNLMTYSLENIKVDQALLDSQFIFHLPDSVSVVDLR